MGKMKANYLLFTPTQRKKVSQKRTEQKTSHLHAI